MISSAVTPSCLTTLGEMKQFFTVTPSVEVTKKTSLASVMSTRSRSAAACKGIASVSALARGGAASAMRNARA